MKAQILEIKLHGPLHHGSGFGLPGILDRLVLRDCSNIPYLAGSAIKGRLRHAALRILLTTGQRACQYADQKAICRDGNPCGVCVLFGSPRRPGALSFGDAYPAPEILAVLRDIAKMPRGSGLFRDSAVRAGTAIDRVRRTVRPHLLFNTETLPEVFVFRGTIGGDAGKHQTLLEHACRLLTHFGAGGARGLGRCEFCLPPSTGAQREEGAPA